MSLQRAVERFLLIHPNDERFIGIVSAVTSGSVDLANEENLAVEGNSVAELREPAPRDSSPGAAPPRIPAPRVTGAMQTSDLRHLAPPRRREIARLESEQVLQLGGHGGLGWADDHHHLSCDLRMSRSRQDHVVAFGGSLEDWVAG